MVEVHRPKFSGKKQLNCLRKVRPVNKGLMLHPKAQRPAKENIEISNTNASLSP